MPPRDPHRGGTTASVDGTPRRGCNPDLPSMLGHTDLGPLILGWLGDDTEAATALRGTCVAARDAVAAHPWADGHARIAFPARWRAAFPRAKVANISYVLGLRDADFVHLRGLHTLCMSYCYQTSITDAAFAHLGGIRMLDMSYCDQATITDAMLERLVGVHTLDLQGCTQLSPSDELLAKLKAAGLCRLWR
jgi:hypothetical protein